MIQIKYYIFLLIISFSAACSSLKNASPILAYQQKIVQLYQQNLQSYSDTFTTVDFVVSCTKVPYQIELLQSLNTGNISELEYQELRKKSADYELFYLQIERKNTNHDFYVADHQFNSDQKFDYLLYTAKKDIKLISGTDTLSCNGLHIEQNPLLRNVKRMQVYFPKSEMTKKSIILKANPLIQEKVEFSIQDIEKKLN